MSRGGEAAATGPNIGAQSFPLTSAVVVFWGGGGENVRSVFSTSQELREARVMRSSPTSELRRGGGGEEERQ
jgi:hypothetical protein